MPQTFHIPALEHQINDSVSLCNALYIIIGLSVLQCLLCENGVGMKPLSDTGRQITYTLLRAQMLVCDRHCTCSCHDDGEV